MRPDVFGDIGDLFWEVRGLRAVVAAGGTSCHGGTGWDGS